MSPRRAVWLALLALLLAIGVWAVEAPAATRPRRRRFRIRTRR